jgi:hypothetical protein
VINVLIKDMVKWWNFVHKNISNVKDNILKRVAELLGGWG